MGKLVDVSEGCVIECVIEDAGSLPVQNKTTTAPNGNTHVTHDCSRENFVPPDVVVSVRRRFGGSGSTRFCPPLLQLGAGIACFLYRCHLLM